MAREMFAAKTYVQRRDVEPAGGRNKEVHRMFVQRRGVRFVRERDVCKEDGVGNRKGRRTPGDLR